MAATPHPAQHTVDGTSGTAEVSQRVPRPRSDTATPGAPTVPGATTRWTTGNQGGQQSDPVDDDSRDDRPSPGRQAFGPSHGVEHDEWISTFLTMLESRGFFDEKKSRDIRAILHE